jgi:transcription termination factor Rho
MEVVLSRDIANHRIFPAIDISKSATRKQELLFEPKEYQQVERFRRGLAGLSPIEAAQALVKKLQQFPANKELLSAFS